MSDQPDSEAAREEKLLAAKKKLQKFQKKKSAVEAPASADGLLKPKRRGSQASSVTSDASNSAPSKSEKKAAKTSDNKDSKPLTSPVASPPTSPPIQHTNLPPASDLFTQDTTSHSLFFPPSARDTPSFFDTANGVSPLVKPFGEPPADAQRQTVATLESEKRVLEDEVRRLMELAKHSRNNESLLAEGTGLVSALTAQNGTLEGKVKTMSETISVLETQLRDLRIQNQDLANSHMSTSNKAESMEFELSSIRQRLARAQQTASEKEEQATQAVAARVQAEERFAEADARRAVLEAEVGELQQQVGRLQDEREEALAELAAAQAEAKARSAAAAETSGERERVGAELEQARAEAARIAKQLKGVTEKMERLGAENKVLMAQVDELREVVAAVGEEKEKVTRELDQTKAVTMEFQAQMAVELGAKDEHYAKAIEEAKRQAGEEVRELQTRLEANRAELELLSARLSVVSQDRQRGGGEGEMVRAQLAVEQARSQDLERRMESLRGGFDELNERYMIVLQENKELTELVEGEVFEGDEFGIGMKGAHAGEKGILGLGNVPKEVLAEYERERRQILSHTRHALDRLQQRYIANGGQGRIASPSSSIRSGISSVAAALTGGSRSSFSADRIITPTASRRASALVQVERPHFHEFHDVPRCSGCIGEAINV